MGTARQNLGYRLSKPVFGKFDVTSSDWGTITDESSFRAFLKSQTGVIRVETNNFSLVNGRLICDVYFKSNYGYLFLVNVNIISFISAGNLKGVTYLNLRINNLQTFNPEIALTDDLQFLDLNNNQIVAFNPTIPLPIGLQNLDLDENQIVAFNPTIPLPIGLIFLTLSRNKMTTQGYIDSETWANSLTPFTNPCVMNFAGNIDSISGTNLEAILLTKNVIITP